MNNSAFFIYDMFEYGLFFEMRRKKLEKCWFYRYSELRNNGIFYFQAINKDGDRKYRCSINIDKYEYEYYDELVSIFTFNEGCYFEIGEYDHVMDKFNIIFKKLFHSSGRIISTTYCISSEGIKLLNEYVEDYRYVPLYETFYKDIYRNIADDRAMYGLYGEEARASMNNINRDFDLISHPGDFNPLRDITMNDIRKQLELPTFTPVPELSKPPIFNPPATICYWTDGTKTVVKCQEGDKYSQEAGLALCYMKKILGNTSRNLNKELHKYISEEKKE